MYNFYVMKRKYLFPINKIAYLKNKIFRENNCILCKVLENSNDVQNLLLHQGNIASITLNLYPYNPGHLMIFPNRHVEDLRELTTKEESEISQLTKLAMNVMDEVYSPQGFNLGYNMGKCSGASIAHLHLHLVPRYPNELGFMDIIGGSKLFIEHPNEAVEKLKKAFKNHL